MFNKKRENKSDIEIDNLHGEEVETQREYYDEESGEYYNEESEEYEDEESQEYYDEESQEYYDEESQEYYDEESQECYEEESEEYYEEESEEYENEESGEYYDEESDEYIEEDLEVENLYEDEEESRPVSNVKQYKKKAGFWNNLSTADKVMGGVGILIAVLAIVVIAVFVSGTLNIGSNLSFADLGSQLSGVTVIGEDGLLAVGNAEYDRLFGGSTQDENTGYDEEAYDGSVIVSLNSLSIMKDLKIKFVNQTTNKLVANVPFSVAVKYPDGTLEYWEDDDQDGMVYRSDIEAGNYVVELQILEDEAYADYILDTTSYTIGVKENIEYEKVDVSDEVKDESDIDVSEDDKGVVEEEVESQLENTVAFVETSKTYIGSTYTEVKKSAVADPITLVYSGLFTRLTETGGQDGQDDQVDPVDPVTYTLSTDTLKGQVDGSDTLTVSASDSSEVTGLSWTTSDDTVATVVDGTVTYIGVGTATITCNITVDTVETQVGTCTVIVETASDAGSGDETPTLTAGTVSLSASTQSVAIGDSVTLTATNKDFTEDVATAWTTSDSSIATVVAGKVTGVKEGTATITATTAYTSNPTISAKATCTVTVTAQRTITFDYTATTGFVNTALNLTIYATPDFTTTTASQFTVTTSDANIATAAMSSDLTKVVVSPIASGTVTITLTYQESSTSTAITTSCVVTVKSSDPTIDKTTQLKDNSGNELYVLKDAVNSDYQKAVYADYYLYDTFYIQSGDNYKYTGWNTIDGNVYYYTADGKYVTGRQVIQGAEYNFASDGSLITGSGSLGIDVSKWNGSIDWDAVKKSGVSYVIIRCGYRGYTSGSLVIDPKFVTNIEGAIAADLKVGVYFYSQAINEIEAVEEASMVLDLIKGYRISYPVFIDVEASGGRADSISVDMRTSVIKAFCQTIENSGYTAGVYANKDWFNNKINTSQLSQYKIWLAHYTSATDYSGRYDLWQYTQSGTVSGISGNVDLNLSYLGY